MKSHAARRALFAVLLAITITHLPLLRVAAQQQDAAAGAQAESPEDRKLREQQEKAKKKEDERKDKEAKARTQEAKKYNTLKDFAEDLYARDPEFHDQVDMAYLDLQSQHALEAYRINTSHAKEYLATENEGEALKLRRALYDNPRVTEYVNRLGQRLVPDDSDKLYAFKVMVNPIPMAYTLSTGTILISTGMISLLDNEAQLSYVLAHELAHVYKDHWRLKVIMPLAEQEYNERQEKKRALWAGLFGIAGAGIGAAINGKQGAAVGALSGLTAGYVISSVYNQKMSTDWYTAQENEADDFALKAMLDHSYDPQEVQKLYKVMAQVAHADSRMQLGFLGSRTRIRERSEYSQRLLGGTLQAQYQDLLKSGKLVGTSPEFNLIMAELKRDNGIEAFYYDMFQMAKMNLQQAYTLRSDDPLATYYYARVLKQVGRSKEEMDQAEQLILTAMRLDTRQSIPEIQLHRALLLIESREPAQQAEAVQSLKQYILAYQRRRMEARGQDATLPPNVDILYDYMRLLGDKNWKAPSDAARAALVNAGGPAPEPNPAANVPVKTNASAPAPARRRP
ncbi:MAG TPA: M48 family metalloprotease [Pyrinomonadaceae bacterium]|jgi:predicted Zn-dependent protease|nr:M48 family metalloprotease [Pyrinomonadaceae bacterium]